MAYKVKTPLNRAFLIYTPTTEKINGTKRETYTKTDDYIMCSCVSYKSTEKEINDVMIFKNVYTIITYYDPTFKTNYLLQDPDTEEFYRICSDIENLDGMNNYIKFKAMQTSGVILNG